MNAQANINTMISIDNKAIIQSKLGRISLLSTLVVSSLPNSPSENLIKKTSDMISNAGSELLDWFDELTIHTNFVRNGITVMDEMFKSLSEMACEELSQGELITANMGFPVH